MAGEERADLSAAAGDENAHSFNDAGKKAACAATLEVWYNGCMKRYLGIAVLLSCGLPLTAQVAIHLSNATHFRETSDLKPPAGAKIAIMEFEDLECPYCAMAAPQVRAAAKQYGIPLVHHDFLIPYHHWSKAAAIDARYLEDNVTPQMAEEFRLD